MAQTPNSAAEVSEERAASKRVGVLQALLPYFAPYKIWVVLALAALTITASVSLILPVAARRVIDGFSVGDVSLLNQYFMGAIAVAAIFALGTGLRYYVVTRLGERVVADLRKAIFDRMIGMSPAYFEKLMTGEVLSRITTDTTLILIGHWVFGQLDAAQYADDVWWIDYDALDLSKADRFGALDRASHFRADFGIRAQIARLVATKPGLDCGLLWEGVGIAFVGTNRTSLYP